MFISSAQLTDVGQVRDSNEDFVLCDASINAFIVCDGVGGHEQGEVASAETATFAIAHLVKHRLIIDNFSDGPDQRDAIDRLITDALQGAGKHIWALAKDQADNLRMGTTATLLLVIGDKGFMGHVGDSRLVLQRKDELHQLSDDHTYLAEVLRNSNLTPEERAHHPMRNVVTRALGQSEIVQVDTLIFDVLPNDTFLLCSDGLHQYVFDRQELLEELSADELKAVPKCLIELANARGGSDNITACVIRALLKGPDVNAQRERTAQVNLRLTTMKHVDLFRYLSHKEILQMQNLADYLEFSTNEQILNEGEGCNALYIILDGEIGIERSGIMITTLSAGAHFGEMALLSARPRTATVRTLKATKIMRITRAKVNELIRKQPVLGVKLLWNFAQVLSLRLEATTEEFSSSAAHNLDDAATTRGPFPF